MIWEKRASFISAMGVAFVAGAIATIVYYQVPHLWTQQKALQTVETKTIPALKSLAGCQEKRAAVLAGQVDADLPNCPSIHSVQKAVPLVESPTAKIAP